VAAALADGPDPDADPVGYAQAQILPLRQITIADPNLHAAVDTLAGAYQAFVATDGSAAAKAAVASASKQVGTLCPGATS
jgi:hypothetical protein